MKYLSNTYYLIEDEEIKNQTLKIEEAEQLNTFSIYSNLLIEACRRLVNCSDICVSIYPKYDTEFEDYIEPYTGRYSNASEVYVGPNINKVFIDFNQETHINKIAFNAEDIGILRDFTVIIERRDKVNKSSNLHNVYIMYPLYKKIMKMNRDKEYELPMIFGSNIYNYVKKYIHLIGPYENRYWGNIAFILQNGNSRECIDELSRYFVNNSYDDVISMEVTNDITQLDVRRIKQILMKYMLDE